MLEVRIDAKSFPGGRPVLRGVAFSLAEGERVAVLGPSGTGKSTLLRIVLGLDADFAGKIRVGAARVGAMFQEPRLLPWMTVGDNIRLVGRDDIPAPNVDELLARVALPGVADKYPRQISLGMARRAALARALAVRPDLLVLDEPFASLDPASAGLLADVARKTEAAMLVATHDLDHALGFATRVLVLHGSPATLAADRCATHRGLGEELRGEFPFLARHGDAAALPLAAGMPTLHPNENGGIG